MKFRKIVLFAIIGITICLLAAWVWTVWDLNHSKLVKKNSQWELTTPSDTITVGDHSFLPSSVTLYPRVAYTLKVENNQIGATFLADSISSYDGVLRAYYQGQIIMVSDDTITVWRNLDPEVVQLKRKK